MDCTVYMIWWRINGIQFHLLIARRVDDVVPHACGDKDCKTVGVFVRDAVQNRLPSSRLATNELIQLMHFLANVLAWLKRHYDELAVLCRV